MQGTLRVNCYVRIKATGCVGKLGNIYRDEDTRRRTFGVDWASEFNSDELERISPAEYHASPTHRNSAALIATLVLQQRFCHKTMTTGRDIHRREQADRVNRHGRIQSAMPSNVGPTKI